MKICTKLSRLFVLPVALDAGVVDATAAVYATTN